MKSDSRKLINKCKVVEKNNRLSEINIKRNKKTAKVKNNGTKSRDYNNHSQYLWYYSNHSNHILKPSKTLENTPQNPQNPIIPQDPQNPHILSNPHPSKPAQTLKNILK